MKTKQLVSLALFVLICVLSINTASAQFRLGVRGGVDVASNKLKTDILKASNRLGFQIGPTAEFVVPISGFGGDISVLYGHKEYKISEKQDNASLSDYNYISVPINLKQRIKLGPLGLFVTGGIYGNVKVGDDNAQNANEVVNAFKHKNFIFGLGAGAGVTLFRNIDLGMYFRGDLTDNYKEEYMDADTFQNKKNQSWTVGLNYYF